MPHKFSKMSRNSPVCIGSRFQDSPKLLMPSRDANITSTKMKLKNSVIKKIYAASIEKARFSLQLQKENLDERLDTLVSVERKFVQNLICFRKKGSVDKLFIADNQKTPKSSVCKNVRKKKGSSISNLSHCRKPSFARRLESGYCSPENDTLSKILF